MYFASGGVPGGEGDALIKDLCLEPDGLLISHLGSVRLDHLHPVVFGGVMRCGDHGAGVEMLLHQILQCRRGKYPAVGHITPCRKEPCLDCTAEGRPGGPGIPSDRDGPGPHRSERKTDGEDKGGGHVSPCYPPDAVCAKKSFSCHRITPYILAGERA